MDLSWNAGVLEHYERDERLIIISEMVRVTRKGGRIIAFVPMPAAYLTGLARHMRRKQACGSMELKYPYIR